MPDRTELDEIFADWLDGRLSGAELAELQARLDADPELRRRAAEYRATAGRIASLGGGERAPQDLADAVLAAATARPVAIAGWRRRWPTALAGLAAAALAGVLLFQQFRDPTAETARELARDVAGAASAPAELPAEKRARVDAATRTASEELEEVDKAVAADLAADARRLAETDPSAPGAGGRSGGEGAVPAAKDERNGKAIAGEALRPGGAVVTGGGPAAPAKGVPRAVEPPAAAREPREQIALQQAQQAPKVGQVARAARLAEELERALGEQRLGRPDADRDRAKQVTAADEFFLGGARRGGRGGAYRGPSDAVPVLIVELRDSAAPPAEPAPAAKKEIGKSRVAPRRDRDLVRSYLDRRQRGLAAAEPPAFLQPSQLRNWGGVPPPELRVAPQGDEQRAARSRRGRVAPERKAASPAAGQAPAQLRAGDRFYQLSGKPGQIGGYLTALRERLGDRGRLALRWAAAESWAGFAGRDAAPGKRGEDLEDLLLVLRHATPTGPAAPAPAGPSTPGPVDAKRADKKR